VACAAGRLGLGGQLTVRPPWRSEQTRPGEPAFFACEWRVAGRQCDWLSCVLDETDPFLLRDVMRARRYTPAASDIKACRRRRHDWWANQPVPIPSRITGAL